MDILVFHNSMLSQNNIFGKNMITLKYCSLLYFERNKYCVDKIKNGDERTTHADNEQYPL